MRGIAEFLIHGRVGSDPEYSYLANGTSRCRVPVCANIPKLVNDKWENTPVWFNIAWFGKMADRLNNRLRKGSIVVIRGDITTYERTVEGKKIREYNFRPQMTSIVDESKQEAPSSSPRPVASSSKASSRPIANSTSAPPSVPPSAEQQEGEALNDLSGDPFGDEDLPF